MSEVAGGVEVVLVPRLRVLEVSQESLASVLEQRSSLTGLTCLLLSCNVKQSVALEPQLLNFIASLHSLTAVKLSSHCSDQLCALLSLSCPSLRIFDAEADPDMSITDHGLSFLSNCRELKSVILNDEGTEHDAEERYRKLSGRGVAQMMAALRGLSLLVCDPHLMKEAIAFLHGLSISRTFSLTQLHLRFANRETLFRVSSLLPGLSSLHLVEASHDVGLPLIQMNKLRSLQLTSFAWLTLDDTYFSTTFESLTSLTLRYPQKCVEPIHVTNLGMWCQCLQSLSLYFYERDSFIIPAIHSDKESFFPALKTLVFEGDISINLLASFLMSLRDLRQLSIFVTSFSISAGEMDSLLLQVVKAGRLAELQVLQCYQWEVALETILYLIDQTPSLTAIWGINLLNLSDQSKEAVRTHIRKNNFNISLNDGIAPEQSRGLDWIGERINQREVRLNNFTRQTHLEEILIELNLL